ncbi:hypothetical protein [Sutcliffiella halmapala]|uniref:hypothetical protein n=1 Tax=Sutcliffiella halmapala TaxID=79882 RepID=UPI0009959F01|nr:hypothetical protein [Sutcliffiella halmapala]
MAKYRKKPVVIEAFQWIEQKEDPQWIVDAIEKGNVYFINNEPNRRLLAIETLEGTMYASRGDFVIKGVQGEIYPCKPEIFEATYEKVD